MITLTKKTFALCGFALALALQTGFAPTAQAETSNCEFRESDYLRHNPDVAAAVRAGTYYSGRHHFNLYGHRENRVYNVHCSGGQSRIGYNGGNSCRFDESAYLGHNPDVANAVRNGTYHSGRHHYDLYGHRENRVYNNHCGGGLSRSYLNDGSCPFKERDYLHHNPDVASAVRNGTYASGWVHYNLYGQSENRIFNSACSGGISRRY